MYETTHFIKEQVTMEVKEDSEFQSEQVKTHQVRVRGRNV